MTTRQPRDIVRGGGWNESMSEDWGVWAIDRVVQQASDIVSTIRGVAPVMTDIARIIFGSLTNGGTLFLAGCGGSAAMAQHLAAELVVRQRRSGEPLSAVALGCNPAIYSAACNDIGAASALTREFEALVRPGDVLMVLTTSGNSESLIDVARAATRRGVPIVALSGRDGGLMLRSDLTLALGATLVVPFDSSDRIQEFHLMIAHIILETVEHLRG